MTFEKLVTQARSIMTEKLEEIIAVGQYAHASTETRNCQITFYKCSGPNHLARDCLQERAEETFA